MKFVSSDTNVGIDFQAIARLQFPFLLPYTYNKCICWNLWAL